MQKVLIGVVIVILGVGAYLLIREDDTVGLSNNQGSSQPASTEDNQQPVTSSTEDQDGRTITYNGESFSPGTLTVNSGDSVTVKNDSNRTIQFDSDPHPAHTDNTELNVDTIRAGQSKTFKAERNGTFGFHDHLNPSATGNIVVK